MGSTPGKQLVEDDPYEANHMSKNSMSRNSLGFINGSKSFDVGTDKSHLINNG